MIRSLEQLAGATAGMSMHAIIFWLDGRRDDKRRRREARRRRLDFLVRDSLRS